MFETSVIRRHMEHGKTRVLSLPLTIALYGIAGALLTIALVWSVELPAKPPDQPTIFTGLAELPKMLPPPEGDDQPAERTEPNSEPEPAAETEVPTTLVEEPPADLDSIPDEEPVATAPDNGRSDSSSSPPDSGDGIGTGSSGPGVPGGFGDENQVYPAALATSQPEVIRSVTPDYPPIALRIRKSGWVVLSCTISKEGLPTEVTVLRSSDPMFEAPALKALRGYLFKPGEIDGRVVRTRFNLTVNFTLQR